MEEEEQSPQPEQEITPQKLAKLKNLKAFRGWSDEEIKKYIREKPAKEPKLFSKSDPIVNEGDRIEYDEAEYKKKYNLYHRRYLKEYSVDMNDANDAQQLESLVRFIIQLEMIDQTIRRKGSNLDARILKSYGDYQRTIQTSITELQSTLGISRKQRKEKNVDDVPQYIRGLQVQAKDYWQRKTLAVTCPRCNIEVARYWLNFPKNIKGVTFEAECTKCHEDVIYSV